MIGPCFESFSFFEALVEEEKEEVGVVSVEEEVSEACRSLEADGRLLVRGTDRQREGRE